MKPGDLIGSWVVDRTLGHGGMGSVFLCHRQDDVSDLAAVKTFPAWSTDDDGFQRFQREIDVLRRLQHPGVVPLKSPPHSDGRDAGSGHYWLAMAFVDGPSLELRLDRGPLPAGYAAREFLVLADALSYAHRQGVVHRDIKPGNIVLGRNGSKLVDFGIALQSERTRLTKEGMFAGTLAYMAPEIVVEEHRRPDAMLGDIYALGVVLYESLTGKRAYFSGEGLSDRQRQMRILRAKLDTECLDPGEGVPAPLREAVRRLTDPSPESRLNDWSEFIRLLSDVPHEDDSELDTLDDASSDIGTVIIPSRLTPRPSRARRPVPRRPQPRGAPAIESADLFDGDDDLGWAAPEPVAAPTPPPAAPTPHPAAAPPPVIHKVVVPPPAPAAKKPSIEPGVVVWTEARRDARADAAAAPPPKAAPPPPPPPVPDPLDDDLDYKPRRRVGIWLFLGLMLVATMALLLGVGIYLAALNSHVEPPPVVEIAAPEPPKVEEVPEPIEEPEPEVEVEVAVTKPKPKPKPRFTKPVTFSSRSGTATVKIDGRSRGSTPVTLELSAGSHRIEMVSPDGSVKSSISVGMDKADEFQFDATRSRVTPIFH